MNPPLDTATNPEADAPAPGVPEVDISTEPTFSIQRDGRVRKTNMQTLQRRKQAALLVAQGKLSDKEIAAMLGVQRTTMTQWKQREDFKLAVDEFSARIVDGAVLSAQERLNADAPTNITFLKGVRDGEWIDDHKRMAVRLRASEALFDRQVPKGSNTDNAVKVVIGGQLLGQMIRAYKHDGGAIDADFEAAVTEHERTLPAPTPEESSDDDAR